MTEKNKPPSNNSDSTFIDIYATSGLDRIFYKSVSQNEPWREWKVKPDLTQLLANPPESGIGLRIAYCRGQLNNLSVEALARYTKNFDTVGVSKASIVRYEAGSSLPGARELRILSHTLWVSPIWLLMGALDSNPQQHISAQLVDHLADFVRMVTDESNKGFVSGSDMRQSQELWEVEQRQRWIDAARKPA